MSELRAIAGSVGTEPLRGLAMFTEGAIAAASSRPDDARRAFEDALELFQRSGAPFEAERARVELAHVLAALGRREAAAEEAGRAGAALTELGAAHEAGRATSLLRELGSELPAAALTKREVEVLRLVADGLSNPDIAARLVVSEHTVHRHVANILNKLRVSSRAAAVAQAVRLQLL
jgi:ATP/maltotriose-dependent transcriptional regulator MalT